MNDSHDPTDAGLALEIAAFVRNRAGGSFEDLILRLFARQYALNEPYRVYCDNLGQSPGNVDRWEDIPAAPARAFKTQTLSCAPAGEVARVFHSSGTTEGQPGRHLLDRTALDLYETSLRAGFYAVVPQDLPILALMPPPGEAPNSSLSYMLGALDASAFHWSSTRELAEHLSAIAASLRPVCVFGTAFALLELFDEQPDARWQLPAGSYVVETGGFKGRTRQVEREELYSLIAERLGLRPPNALAEYGMSEMASQYYGASGQGLAGGHWVRARIVDPISGIDADEGVLRHYDLANWNSVAVIQTEDMARRLAGGRFELLGRAPFAGLRGCSLTVEERWLSASSTR